ncbi:MAG TPA: hypothetical protein VJ794_12335 [Gemmatimonadales bacterium]|nr:hypothetical protein [Gemmatimonadales bacterium]
MLLLLLATLHTAQNPTDTVLAAARRAVVQLNDTAAARAAGYRPITEIGIPDNVPFQGQHWSLPIRDTTAAVPLERPAFLMFGPVNGAHRRIGLAYSTRLLLKEPSPDGLSGDPTAKWHDHFWCDSVPGRPEGFVVNQQENCGSQGGVLNPRRAVMVHVWTDVDNPEGVYGHDNPALPFVALGLTPPTQHELHDQEKARAIRKLAWALGEAYDARLPLTRRIERENRDSALAGSLQQRRKALAALIPALKRAEGDRSAYQRAAAQVVSEWEAILGIYERMASPELRPRVKRRHEAVIAVSAHH